MDPTVRRVLLGTAALGAAALAVYIVHRRIFRPPKFDLDAFGTLIAKSRKLGKIRMHKPSTLSTQTDIRQLVEKLGEHVHGMMVIADEQTAGVGRRGRSWSGGHENLTFSFAWCFPPQSDLGQMAREMLKMNFAVSVATALACRSVGVKDACVKWPNDVWVRGKKVSGMLVDSDGKSTAMAGVGINVNWVIPSSDPLHAHATSLCMELGRPVWREAVLASFVLEFERLMGLSMAQVLAEYAALDGILGKTVRVHHATREIAHPSDYNAVAVGFAEDGGLTVRRADTGQTVVLRGEEVSITPQ